MLSSAVSDGVANSEIAQNTMGEAALRLKAADHSSLANLLHNNEDPLFVTEYLLCFQKVPFFLLLILFMD